MPALPKNVVGVVNREAESVVVLGKPRILTKNRRILEMIILISNRVPG